MPIYTSRYGRLYDPARDGRVSFTPAPRLPEQVCEFAVPYIVYASLGSLYNMFHFVNDLLLPLHSTLHAHGIFEEQVALVLHVPENCQASMEIARRHDVPWQTS